MKSSPFRGRALLLAVFAFASPSAAQQPPPAEPGEPGLGEMSLEQLLTVSVVSASNRVETVADAPATVFVITRDDIARRGYTEMSEILDDLPGMDVVRPWGDTYLKDYWRGYRNTIGDPFLLMVDGLVQNHLYFNTADSIVNLALSNVERVEVVYGPASSVYGPNAFMGVINVITRKDRPSDGTSVSARLTAGGSGTRIVDASALYKNEGFRLSATARFDHGDFDPSHTDAYEYTKARYLADRRLWGGFVDNGAIAGTFLSHHANTAADLRIFVGELELGALYDEHRSGYGVVYTTDSVQTNAVWTRPQLSLFGRVRHAFGPLASTTLVRWRRSDLANDSTFLEGYSLPDGTRVADFSYWQSLNRSWTVNQDFEWSGTGAISVSAGLKWEQKDLQKAYDINYGPALPVAQIDAATYPYPRPPVESSIAQNRIMTEDFGVYAQGKLRIAPHETVHLGVRFDHNSRYGTTPTLRVGWVGSFGALGLKMLYGEAFQEPVQRLLYGGWRGSGSDPNLNPERSQTVELSGAYTKRAVTALVSGWWVGSRDTIVNTASGAQNLGDRTVTGVDLTAQLLLPVPAPIALRAWGFWSHLFSARERKLDSAGRDEGMGPVGDLASDKLFLGLTGSFKERITATVRARWVSRRETVSTNPVRAAPAFASVDASVSAKDVGVRGLGVLVKLTNALDETILHPGIRQADGGSTPGSFDAQGTWHGSGGFYTSLMPQPGRLLTVTATLDF